MNLGQLWPLKITSLFLALSSASMQADVVKKSFRATAKTREGAIAYLEKHEVQYENSIIRSAYTSYERENGEVIATLKSDFSQSVTTPEHIAENKLNGDRYGVRREGDSLLMFKQDGKDQLEKLHVLKNGFAGESLAVAGQGITYYIQANLDKIRSEKTTKLTLLIPGRLKHFAFKMEMVSEIDGVMNIEFTASYFIIRLFVPKIKVQFDVKNKQLIRYEGVSNISDTNGDIRDVVIVYDYLN